MKTTILVGALLLLWVSPATAQVSFGLKAGPMLSRTYFNLGDTLTGFSDFQATFVGGGFIRVPLSEKFDLQAELLYATKGANAFNEFNYLSVPLMVQYEFLPDLRVEAGAEIAYLLNNLYAITPEYDYDIGINAGLSYDFLDKFMAGLRYNLGVLDTSRPRVSFGNTDRTFDPKETFHTLQLTLCYRFR